MGSLVIGATSAIAQAIARRLIERGDSLYLIARRPERLEIVADDLKARGALVCGTAVMDALDYAAHETLVRKAAAELGGIDLAIVAHGTLPDQETCERSWESTRREFEVNALSVISLLTHLGSYFEARARGQIVVISSVAGDRGRQSNYVYGSAKSAVSTFSQGLANRYDIPVWVPRVLFIISAFFGGLGLALYAAGWALKMDVAVLTIASVATKAGPPLVPAIAESKEWRHLVLPGIILGMLGYAVGNYAGLAVAYAARAIIGG